ncbi:MAG: hypothetical protein RLZ33_2892, partial [Bacteroidota bacterium]
MVKRILPFLIVVLTTNAFSQNTSIDVLHYTLKMHVYDSTNRISVEEQIDFNWLDTLQSPMFDLESLNSRGKGMVVSAVTDHSSRVSFLQEGQQLKIVGLKAVGRKQLSLVVKYEGIPSDGLVISANKYGDRTFFGDNWPNRAHLWFACNDHPSDKATIAYEVTAPKNYEVIANGAFISRTDISAAEARTTYESSVVLPTKVMVVGIANFEIKSVPNSDSSIEIS